MLVVMNMVEFIICDDDKKFLKQVEDLISKIMVKKKFEYDIVKFYDYDDKFFNHIETKDGMRIFILDIETPTNSGIIVGRKIRKTDYESPIIFLTGHEELGNMLLRKDLMFLAFINKFEEFNTRLRKTIEKALAISNKRDYLEIEDRGAVYRILHDKILYITRDTVERKTLIVTENNTHKIMKSLSEIVDILDDRFIQTHRSCIINKNRSEEINYKQKYILFDNGIKIDLISNNYKTGEKENAK